MHPARPSDGAHRHRGLEATHKVSFVVDLPLGHGGITARSDGRPSVATGLDGTPILAAGDGHGADGVHDALVVRGRPVRVGGGEVVGFDDASDHLSALCGVTVVRHGLGAKAGFNPRHALCGQVGQDAEQDASTGERLDAWRDQFGHGVDRVGTHRVPDVNMQVDHEHRAQFCRNAMAGQAFQAPSKLDHGGRPVVAHAHQFLLGSHHGSLCGVQIHHVQHLDLCDHDGRVVAAHETAC